VPDGVQYFVQQGIGYQVIVQVRADVNDCPLFVALTITLSCQQLGIAPSLDLVVPVTNAQRLNH